MIGTMQVKVLSDFYKELLGTPTMEQDGWVGWQVGGVFFSIGEHSEMGGKSKDSGRLMFNFDSTDVKGDFERIKAINGVEIVKEPYEMGEGDQKAWIATFADPDGNYFQLMTPWDDVSNQTK